MRVCPRTTACGSRLILSKETRGERADRNTASDSQMSRVHWIAALAACFLLAPGADAQGFGSMGKKKITLHRKLPPVIHFTGTSFSVKASAHDPKNTDVAGSLKDLLETELLKDNDKLKTDSVSPELLVTCTVISFEMPPPQPFTRTEVELDKGKQIEQPVKYNKITGLLEVAYQAKDPRTGKSLDADNIEAKYSEDFEAGANQQGGKSLGTKMIDPFKRAAGKKTENSSGPPTATELRELLIHDAVHEIASRITTTDEPVEVMLAQGKLDKANKIAENGLWTRYLEELEQMTPLSPPKDDAYRLYNIGVAYEALAYQSEDREAARKFLQEAAINYGKAVDEKPDEKYFLEPQKRIETAMSYYRRLEEQRKSASIRARRLPQSPAVQPPRQQKAPPPNPRRRVQASQLPRRLQPLRRERPPERARRRPLHPLRLLSRMSKSSKCSKAGVDQESIISTIHDAPVVNLDLSPDGQIALAGGGVKGKIVAAMRARSKLPNKKSASGSN